MKQVIAKFFRDEEGATAIEYGLIAGLISVVILLAVTSIGDNLVLTFDAIATALTPAPVGP